VTKTAFPHGWLSRVVAGFPRLCDWLARGGLRQVTGSNPPNGIARLVPFGAMGHYPHPVTASQWPDQPSAHQFREREDTTGSFNDDLGASGAADPGSTPRAIPVLIVSYGNSADVVGCLLALCRARTSPAFEIFLCENGGPESYRRLIAALTAEDGPCQDRGLEEHLQAPMFVRRRVFGLRGEASGPRVHVGEARENLGYAGGINAWLRPLLAMPGWPAVWILNPDTQPAPDALSELVAYADRWNKGMVGSRLVPTAQPDRVHSRGLRWVKGKAGAHSVDLRAPADFEPDPEEVDSRIDSPSGASMYVTRPCIEHIGLMDEQYFLFFEDLEWGIRAKADFGIGYAHRSIVNHAGGTTIGSSVRASSQSALSIYLENRNSILFVRKNFPGWLVWTIVLQYCRTLIRLRIRSFGNMIAALRGVSAGIRGQTGRPDRILRRHNDIRGWRG
jgi:GT2 family glycosyltransferase